MTIWLPDLARKTGPRYLAIVEALADDLECGRLGDGDRLPTHRDLAYRLGVTVGTVTRAYAEAERRGLIKGEVGRGTYVRAAGSAAMPSLHDVEERADVIDLSMNYPVNPDADAMLAAGLRKIAARPGVGRLLEYLPCRGRSDHRAAGAAWLRRLGLKADPAEIVVSAGGQNAISAVLANLAGPGDVVLTESLTYPGVMLAAALFRFELVGLDMDAHGILPDAFDRACRGGRARALFCMPTLQNPSGAHMPVERRREIARIARHHGVKIVEDDVYGFLVEGAPAPLVSHAPELGFYIASLSKAVAPGLRVGFVASPKEFAAPIANVVRATTFMAPPVLVDLACQWIGDGTSERLAAQYRAEAKIRQGMARTMLTGLNFRANPAAYHLWLELPEHWTATHFAAEARQRGVIVTPADVFAVTAPAPRAIRLCLSAARGRDELRRALGIVAALAQQPHDHSLAVV